MNNKRGIKHSRECEIMAYGVCTCEFWDHAKNKTDVGIQEVQERMAGIVALCNEHRFSQPILDEVKNLALGKKRYVPPSKR